MAKKSTKSVASQKFSVSSVEDALNTDWANGLKHKRNEFADQPSYLFYRSAVLRIQAVEIETRATNLRAKSAERRGAKLEKLKKLLAGLSAEEKKALLDS